MRKPSHRFIKVSLIFFAILISLTIIYFKDTLTNFSQYGYLSVFIVSFLGSATILLPVPSLMATFTLGNIYNPLIIGPIAATGAALGELTGYLAGLGGQAFINTKQKKYLRFQKLVNRYGLVAIIVLAAIPNPLFDLVSIAAGVIGIKPIKFFLAAWLGQIIKFTLTAYLGAFVI